MCKKDSMNKSILILLALVLLGCGKEVAETEHQPPTHNFTVMRLLIVNEQNELLMGQIDSNWYAPSLVYNQRQFIQESLDSLSAAYGVTTSSPILRGYFSFKYAYHPYATLRPYYLAKYQSGALKVPTAMEAVKWMPISEAIANTPVEAMQEIMQQLFNYPASVWGGSFLVYTEGEEHHTRNVEPFYTLFDGAE